VLAEMQAAQNPDTAVGLVAFDRALFAHMGYTIKNGLAAFWHGLSGSHTVSTPDVAKASRRYYQQLTRFSSAFAFLADVSLLVLGGGLKRREKISARLGDILAQMYLISATLKRFEAEGRQVEDEPLMHWSIWDAMYKAQQAFDGVLANYPSRLVAWGLGKIIFPFGHPYVVPSDEVGHRVAKILINPGAARDRLTAGCYIPATAEEPVGAVELAMAATVAAERIEAKIREAERAGRFENNPHANVRDIAKVALEAGVVTTAEYITLAERNRLRDIVVRVDDFPYDFGIASGAKPVVDRRAA
jgi:acyl-CoA dehydrogenase